MSGRPSPLLAGASELRPDAEVDEEAVREESRHFYSVVLSFAEYERFSFNELQHVRHRWSRVDVRHRELLPDYDKKFDYIISGIKANYNFLIRFLQPYIVENLDNPSLFQIPGVRVVTIRPEVCSELPPQIDQSKVQSTLKQFVREWSLEGLEERRSCFGSILQALENEFPEPTTRSSVKVLIPGSGLGRLPWEIARLGFSSQGNEFSFYMLIASNFVLNFVSQPNMFKLYPWIHQRSNVLNARDQLRGISIPDVSPTDLKNRNFSMVAGDFIEVYSEPNQLASWDVIVTCFFVDTARNIFQYIDTIRNALKPGGLWINFGPLLYHFADHVDILSVELSYDEFRECVQKSGFTILEERTGIPTNYTVNARSMLRRVYACGFFVARKMPTEEEDIRMEDKISEEKQE